MDDPRQSFTPGAEAEAIGLVNETLPDDELYDRVEALADEVVAGPRFAQAMAKEAVNLAFPGRETALAMEEALSTAVFETKDAREGITAFIEDRRRSRADGYNEPPIRSSASCSRASRSTLFVPVSGNDSTKNTRRGWA